jgi:hypothetical protein
MLLLGVPISALCLVLLLGFAGAPAWIAVGVPFQLICSVLDVTIVAFNARGARTDEEKRRQVVRRHIVVVAVASVAILALLVGTSEAHLLAKGVLVVLPNVVLFINSVMVAFAASRVERRPRRHG